MGQNIKTVALIPLRGGSKSIPLKNIKVIAGKPLCHWTIEAAVKSRCIDMVFVATDCKRIEDTVKSYKSPKVQVIGRSAESSTDTASTESIMLEFAEQFDFENIFLIQATSPLLEAEDLDKGFEKYQSSGADSMLSVVEQKRFLWKKEGDFVLPSNYDFSKRPRRQEFEGFLVENGAFYLTTRKRLLEAKCRLSGNVACQIMKDETYNELDEETDWTVIETFLSARQKN